jgi:hypothetical protein
LDYNQREGRLKIENNLMKYGVREWFEMMKLDSRSNDV